MSNFFIKDANQVVVCNSGPKRGRTIQELQVETAASVFIENGTIAAVGPMNKIEQKITGNPTVIEANGKTVLPGFIDAHTHLVFAGTREDEFAMRVRGATYQEIAAMGGGILRTVKDTRRATRDELIEVGLQYLQLALENGTTTMEIKTGYGLDTETELKMLDVIHILDRMQPVDLVPTFIGAHAIPPDVTLSEYVDQVLHMLPQIAKKVKFCDVFCEKGYFGLDETRLILQSAKEHGLIPRLHADQFANNNAVELAVELGAISVDHLEQINDKEIACLAGSETCATLLPGVSLFLNYGYPPARKIIDAGAIVSLATDFNPGSCMCLSMQLIMSLACTQMRMRPEEAINAATSNAAYSLGLDGTGSLQTGKTADLIIMDVRNYRMIPYFFGQNHVSMVFKNGKVVYSR